MTAARNPWLANRGRAATPRLRLLCIPHAGSGAVAYQPWCEALPPWIDVCRVQLPGREVRFAEPAFDDVRKLVPALAEGLAEVLIEPFAVFGHSMGALVGFELTRYLRRQQRPGPVALLASGHRAPQLPHPRPPVARASDERFLEELRWMGGTPDELFADAEMLEVFLPTLRNDVHLWESYRFDAEPPPLDCRLAIFGGRKDPVATPDELGQWSQHTTGTVSEHWFDGDHFYLEHQREPLLATITDVLAKSIEPGA